MDSPEALLKRLLEAAQADSRADLARRLGIRPHSVYPAVKRGKIPPAWLLKIAERFNISVDWLLTGQGDMELRGPGPEAPAPAPEAGTAEALRTDYIFIPVYNVQAEAGAGRVPDYEEIVDLLAFKKSWIRQALGARPEDLYLIYIEGDSMEPTLRAGDIVLVHRGRGGPVRDGIHVVRISDSILVKRLQALPGGLIKVISDNPAFESFTIGPDHEHELGVIGRVVWAGRRL